MIEIPKEQPKKYRSVVIDTINQIIADNVIKQFRDKNRLTHDDWRDYAVDVLDLFNFCRELPNTVLVNILGYESTGKTVGAGFLNPDETYYINADKKPLTFPKAKEKYNADNRKNYAVPTTYAEIRDLLKRIHAKSKDPLIIFMLGHIEDYKSASGELKQRLKIPGKMAHKYNIDGAVVHCYYTFMDTSKDYNDSSKYQLLTQNAESLNTARSPMGFWDSLTIPNNYQLIVDKILENY